MLSRHGLAAACAALIGLGAAAGAQEQSQSAEAVRLVAASEDVVVAADGSFTDTAHTEMRAVNEAGAMQASRISIYYDSETQTVDILEAHTLKKDGTKIPVDVRSIYEQMPSDNMLAVTSFRIKVLLFPQFSAGDTAVYTVRTNSPKAMLAGSFQFGKVFPRAASFSNVRMSVTAPKAMAMKIETHDVAFSKQAKDDTITYTWKYNAEAVKQTVQPLISSFDREPRFVISSFKSYGELGAAYARESDPKTAVTPKIQQRADAITEKAANRREQARLIYEWVATQIRYVAIELGRGSLIPHDADTVLSRGYGDCKDHDVLLQALLKAKGIAAESILLNAESAYTLTEAPGFSQLNHVITYLPEFNVYLDSSTPVLPFGVLTVAEYGKPAVRATLKSAGTITMPQLKSGMASIHTTTTQKISADGVMTGTTTTIGTGTYGATLRMIGYAVQAVGREKAGEMQLARRGFRDSTGKLTEAPLSPLTDSYTIQGDFTIKGWGDMLKGDASIIPGGLRVLSVTGDDMVGPLYAEDNLSAEPTTCVSSTADEDVSLELPQGYTLRYVPEDEKFVTPNLSFTAHWTLSGPIVKVHRTFTSTVSEPVCRGAQRKEIAAALKKIAATYDKTFEVIRSNDGIGKADKPAAPSGTDEQLARGEAFLAAKDYKQAIATLTGVLAADPHNTKALFDRGYAYDMQNDKEKAIADYSKLIDLDDTEPSARYNRGLNYMSMGKEDLAIADFTRTIELKGDNTDVFLQRGIILLAQNKTDRAMADFERALTIQSNNALALTGRCAVHLTAKEYDKALADCDKAIANDKTLAFAFMVRADVRHAMGDHYGGNRDSAAAAKIDPNLEKPETFWYGLFKRNFERTKTIVADANSPEAAYIRGSNLVHAKKYSEAAVEFERAIKLGANDRMVLPSYCVALSRTDRMKDAAYQCARALQLNENDQSLLRTRGLVNFRLARYSDALEDFNTLVRLQPDDAMYLYQRGVTRKKMGDAKGDADIAKARAKSPNVDDRVPAQMRL